MPHPAPRRIDATRKGKVVPSHASEIDAFTVFLHPRGTGSGSAGSQRGGPSLTVRPDHVAGCEGVQRLRPGEGHVAGEAIVENLLQFLAFRLDLCGAHAHLLLGCGRALRRRLGDERNHTGKETRPELDLAPRRRLSHNHKRSPEAWVGFNIRFRCIDHG